MSHNPGSAPTAAATPSSLVLLLATCIPNVLVNVNTSAISVLLPDIADDTGATIQSLQWTVSGYSLVSAASIIAAGSIADRVGRRLVFLVGLFLFAACSIAVALSTTGLGVIAARSLQGMSAAIVVAGSLVLVTINLPPERRLFGTTMWGASAAIGAAIGPLVGGLFAAISGWPGVFWFSAIGMLVCVPVVLWKIPESTGATVDGGLDWPGVGLIATSMVSLILYATYGGDLGWASLGALGLLGLSIVSAIGFVAVERRTSSPLVDLALLRNLPFVGSTLGLIVFNCTFTAFVIAWQLYLQNPLGANLSSLASGAALLPVTVMLLLASLAVPRVTARIGMRVAILGGAVAMALGFAALIPVDTDWVWAYAPCFVLLGLGGAFLNGPITAVATGAVRPEQAGAASGVNNMARYLGAALSAPLATGIYLGVSSSRLTDDLTELGASDPSGSADTLVNASGTKVLDELAALPASAADAVTSATASAISAGMATLALVLALLMCIDVLLALVPGIRRHRASHRGFDAATVTAATAYTLPRTERNGAPASSPAEE